MTMERHPGSLLVFPVLALLVGGLPVARSAEPAGFVACQPGGDFQPPPIVLHYDPATGSGANWAQVSSPDWWKHGKAWDPTSPVDIGRAARFLQEGLKRMTGREFPVSSGTDLSRGIILVLRANAPNDVRNDVEVEQALKADPHDPYADQEAYFIRSEPTRVLLVANRPDGLLDAVVELLESVDYEVLGLGPNWTYVPDYSQKPLVFSLRRSGRAGFYLRRLFGPATFFDAGNLCGVPLSDAADEPHSRSFERWVVGTRLTGASIAPFPGHALQRYDAAVIEYIKKNQVNEGFLVDNITVGPAKDRPASLEKGKTLVWIHNDPEGSAGAGKVSVYNGPWGPGPLEYSSARSVPATLDISVPWVREIILDALKKQSEGHFAQKPDTPFIFGNEPEDGAAYKTLGRLARHPNWYPDYLKSKGIPFGQPYVLHGFGGLDQPTELWDPASASDHVFGLHNWLLREYDAWIDTLPPAQRTTSSGQSKKTLVRVSGFSYYEHDVPPDFNLDPRIQVMIAGFPVHRGRGKWKNVVGSRQDTARAFQRMLPHSPSGDYRIQGTYHLYQDAASGIRPYWDQSASAIWQDLRSTYQIGIRAVQYEIEHAFGRNGLGHYLQAKMLWNPTMTSADLEALRDRWFRRAFGGAWQEMKAYYDFMLTENYRCNTPTNWAKAIRLIDAAERKIDPAEEPQAQRRIDDVKTFWYFYYLFDSGQGTAQSPAMKEFVWKGQSANMVTLRLAVSKIFKVPDARTAAGPEYAEGPAHYTHQETQTWWQKVLDHWPAPQVDLVADLVLANGRKGAEIDLFDLVAVQEFSGRGPIQWLVCHNRDKPCTSFYTIARREGEAIGFVAFEPSSRGSFDLHYGVACWDPAKKEWQTVLEMSRTAQKSETVKVKWGWTKADYEIVTVRTNAPRPGVYRFDLGSSPASGLSLTTLDFDADTGKFRGEGHSQTFFGTASGTTQSGIYFYIPKGTANVDLDVWTQSKTPPTLTLHTGLPAAGMKPTRTVPLDRFGANRVTLQAGEAGSFGLIEQNGFAVPYFFSVPGYWAKSPSLLLVPRAIAEADGLTVLK